MLFNHILPFVALVSLAVPIFAAPIEPNLALDSEELKIECDKTYTELEDILDRKGIGLPIDAEAEAKIVNLKALCTPVERTESKGSVAAVFLAVQSELDTLKQKIEAVMAGPIGSIEKQVGEMMNKVHAEVGQLKAEIRSFIGAEPSVVYGNPAGGTQLTNDELVKVIHTFLSHVSHLEETVKNVSGYTFTSAQQNIRKDILAVKKTLGIISSEVADGVANMILLASMGPSASA
ncbi:unnamed protein product [Rhizoctonia solani]|uniref:Uncharacterized protein n=1 Tax=Rhizoctonia solani TaxID=456999 RepID=A0A8H3GY41_9AGAM|nr:unnamed protein product [Rhizoctonia solani]